MTADTLRAVVESTGLTVTTVEPFGDAYRVYVEDFGSYQGQPRQIPGKAVRALPGWAGMYGSEPVQGYYLVFRPDGDEDES